MKKREKIMIAVTLACVALALVFVFYPENAPEVSDTSAGGGNLDSARETFHQYKQTLADRAEIEKKYKAIAFGQPEHIAGKDPGETFQDQLSQLLAQQFGKIPRVTNPKNVELKNVDEYYFINIDVTTSGTHDEMMRLMENMQRMGLLIQSFQLTKESGVMSDQINMEITVARLVKHDAESKKRLSLRRGRN